MPPQRKIDHAPGYGLGVRQTIESREAMGRTKSSSSSSNNLGQSNSSLVALLMLKWSWGEVPSTFLQEVALAAVQDGCPHQDVIRLSKLGASGRHRGNINRDLEQIMGQPMWSSCLLSIGLTIQMASAQASWERIWFVQGHHRFSQVAGVLGGMNPKTLSSEHLSSQALKPRVGQCS